MTSHPSRGLARELAIARDELGRFLEPELDRLARARFRARRAIPPEWWIYIIGAAASVLLGYLLATANP